MFALTQRSARAHAPPLARGFNSARNHIPVIRSLGQMRRWRAQARSLGLEVGLIPTMGALHDGHLNLVRASVNRHPLTVMSLFVNPTQFAPHEDLNAYPRTFESDMDKLRGLMRQGPAAVIHGLGISEYDRRLPKQNPGPPQGESPLVVFAPTVDTMYPLRGELQNLTEHKGATIHVQGWGDVMEGASRPQFFTGVSTVCTKLFNAVEPDHAYFGQKDIQQALLLKILQQDLLSSHPPPENLHILPTTRDKDTGLALSSRNSYLSEPELKVAPVLQRALKAASSAWDNCASGSTMIEVANRVVAEEQERIHNEGDDVVLTPDYFEVFDRQTFAPFRGTPTGEDKLVISGALRVGKTRLIDNLLLGWDAEALDVSNDV
ncbi:hypothetical protein CspHIS471_0609550 [Cutaneotrichosporon sp. HIS471]|nr:hypothetical protein CspHIS471_0609550 [Cutaneotrichosporon sp. HIS471]